MKTIHSKLNLQPNIGTGATHDVVADHWLEMAGRFQADSVEVFGKEVDAWLESLQQSLSEYESPRSRGESTERR